MLFATGSLAPTCGDQPSGEVAAGTWMTGAVDAKSDAWMVLLVGFQVFQASLVSLVCFLGFAWFVSLTLEIPGRLKQKPHVRYALWHCRAARSLHDQLMLGGVAHEIRAYKDDQRFRTLHHMTHHNSTRYPEAFGGHPFWACVMKALDDDDHGEASRLTAHTHGSWMEGFIGYSSMWELIVSFAWHLLFGLQLISCHCLLAIGFVDCFGMESHLWHFQVNLLLFHLGKACLMKTKLF